MAITVNANATAWVNSGVTIPAGHGLMGTAAGSISPTGAVSFGVIGGSAVYSYPEGRYPNGGGFPQTFTYDPTLCTPPPNASTAVAPDLWPQCLVLLVLPVGTNPGSAPCPTGKGIRGDRSFSVAPGDSRLPVGVDGVAWLWFNDGPIPGGLTDNSGFFTVTLSATMALPPGPPTDLSWGGCAGTVAVLTWDAVTATPAVLGYRVYRDGVMIADVGDVGAAPTEGLTFTDTGLVVGVGYVYAVSAYSSAGEGAMSVSVAVTACMHCVGFTRETVCAGTGWGRAAAVDGGVFGRAGVVATVFARTGGGCGCR